MKKIIIIFGILLINILLANPCHAIKIGLLTNVERAGVGTDVAGRMISVYTNKTVATTQAMKGYILVPYKGQIAVESNGQYTPLNTDALVLRTDTTGFVSTKGKWYRGKQ